MRSLAIIAAALLLGACAAESTEPESAPAPATCNGVAPQKGNKLWDDDWLAPVSAPQGCLDAPPVDDDQAGPRPQSLNTYISKAVGERQGAFTGTK